MNEFKFVYEFFISGVFVGAFSCGFVALLGYGLKCILDIFKV